jgi:hypothetical protein
MLQYKVCDLLLLLLLVVAFMHGIYNYIPETNHVPRLYNVAANGTWRMVHVMLFPMLNVLYLSVTTFQRVCAVPSMAVYKVNFALEQAMKAQRGNRGIAVLFISLGARWRWVVSATPWPIYPRERDLVPITQETG